MKKHRVTLTAAERQDLGRLLSRGKADVRRLKHAQILLKADEAGVARRAHRRGARRRARDRAARPPTLRRGGT